MKLFWNTKNSYLSRLECQSMLFFRGCFATVLSTSSPTGASQFLRIYLLPWNYIHCAYFWLVNILLIVWSVRKYVSSLTSKQYISHPASRKIFSFSNRDFVLLKVNLRYKQNTRSNVMAKYSCRWRSCRIPISQLFGFKTSFVFYTLNYYFCHHLL